MKSFALIIMLLPFFTGCATTALRGTQTDAQKAATAQAAKTIQFNIKTGDNLTFQEIQDNNADIEKNLAEVLTFCEPILSGFEEGAVLQSKIAYWLSISGLVAGAVAVPALSAASPAGNTAWIAGLGGWAGATNFASQALRESGLSGSAVATTRNSIIGEIQTQFAIALNGTLKPEVRSAAVLQAKAACVLYKIAVPNIPTPAK